MRIAGSTVLGRCRRCRRRRWGGIKWIDWKESVWIQIPNYVWVRVDDTGTKFPRRTCRSRQPRLIQVFIVLHPSASCFRQRRVRNGRVWHVLWNYPLWTQVPSLANHPPHDFGADVANDGPGFSDKKRAQNESTGENDFINQQHVQATGKSECKRLWDSRKVFISYH